MPIEEEVRIYCKERPLYRPNTTIIAVLKLIGKYILISSVLATVLILICITKNCTHYKIIVSAILMPYLLIFAIKLRYICIKLVECYQHYASEDLRRSCVCMPTCSEYAIMVLKKYNLVKAFKLIFVRLVYGCKGNYHKDFP